jgi:hypothetical protein
MNLENLRAAEKSCFSIVIGKKHNPAKGVADPVQNHFSWQDGLPLPSRSLVLDF